MSRLRPQFDAARAPGGGTLSVVKARAQRIDRRLWCVLLAALLAFGPGLTGSTWLKFLMVLLALYGFFRLGTGRELWRSRLRPPFPRLTIAPVAALLLLPALLWLPQNLNPAETNTAFTIALYAVLGIGLNVVVGFAGLLDLGYVAFFAVGAYTVGLLSSQSSPLAPNLHVTFWLLVPLAMLIAACAGFLLGIPVLPLRGDYLAIVTLGFGEIIRILVLNASSITNGTQGLYLIAKPSLGGFTFADAHDMYLLAVLLAFLAAFVTLRLLHSRVGRAWEAIREDEDVAEAMGIDTTAYKLLAFAIGAAIGGLGGALFAGQLGAFTPAEFDLFVSINVLSLVIIGGMGSIPGVVMGSVVLLGLPDVLRQPPTTVLFFHFPAGLQSALSRVSDYRLIAYGALLVVVVVLRPAGFLPSRRRQLEFEQTMEPDELPGDAGQPPELAAFIAGGESG